MSELDSEKQAFTLAEVLITLTVIGVIASLTVPVLLQNIQQQHLRTQWKTAYSIIEQANKRALIDYGGDFTGIFLNTIDMRDKLKRYFNYTKECSLGLNLGNCWPSEFYSKDGNPSTWSNMPAIVLNNGMFIRFYMFTNGTTCTENRNYTTGECGAYEIDINGFKKPNTIGEDIFFIHILSNKIIPAGVPETVSTMRDCSSNGAGCGLLYLMQ